VNATAAYTIAMGRQQEFLAEAAQHRLARDARAAGSASPGPSETRIRLAIAAAASVLLALTVVL
jgi:hypothetical protein